MPRRIWPLFLCIGSAASAASPPGAYLVRVDANPAHALNHFSPQAAIGAGVDGVPFHAVPEIYTPSNIQQMLGAGLGAVSYRLYTELSVQDWHWNPAGTYSETDTQGYWTSNATPDAKIVDTFGYRLPRRGFTTDQGNNDDYSRLDDGDLATFWKSNPYLTASFTGDPDAAHPQWVLFDLGGAKTVDAARIAWAAPFAVQYAVQYWTGDDPIYDPANGKWVTFPTGTINNGSGGTVTLPLGSSPKNVRYIRIVMTAGSGTCTRPNSPDKRDCTGYAIAEVGLGTLDNNGNFTDLVKHVPNQKQTITYASSVDPWNQSTNRVRNQEQPGLDIVFQSGITRGLPATVPIPMLYSTPANAAAELRYLEAQGYAIARIEMGEEPDGQYVVPEDYAALYSEFATALHTVDPAVKLGGPVFESNSSDVKAWPDANGETSWTKRFVAYLTSHNHLADLTFFSFEHYPFGACGSKKTQQNLLREPHLAQHITQIWRQDNLPPNLPIYITEMNYSQNETDAAQQIAGALWYTDVMAGLLSIGGAGAFVYEYEPIPLSSSYPCHGFGSYGVLLGNGKYQAQAPVSQYFAAQMLTQIWAQAGTATHTLYDAKIGGNQNWVTSYPLQRPDDTWAVLLVNRDLANAHTVQIEFDGTNGTGYFTGTVTQSQFGQAQYAWIQDGRHSHPNPDGPIATMAASGGAGTTYALPAGSLTVLAGTVSGD